MCGIFGMVGRRDHGGLREAALTLRHRGPDGFGEWSSPDRVAYLAHCRLSIIDLSEAGRQPMANEDGTVQLTFNGEIYNFKELRAELVAAGHRFASQTDSEVIVHGYEEWGDDVVTRLRGIFAFAIWDEGRQRLLLARDRVGVKPVYYCLQDGEFVFASETRALLDVRRGPRAADPAAVMELLRYGFVRGAHSIWEGMSRLPPASTLVFDAASGVSTLSRYWSAPVQGLTRNIEQATEELDDLLADAVREELVADVPVGCFLSGGLDSSLVCSFAVEESPRIRSYFADFPGWAGSERDDAALVSAHLGTSHHVDDIPGAMRVETGASVFDAFDEPIGDTAIIPSWHLSKAIARHVKVALSGDGGDELFAGYSRYAAVLGTPRRRLAWFAETVRRQLGAGRPWPEGCAGPAEYFEFLMCPGFSTPELVALFPSWQREAVASAPGVAASGHAAHDSRDWQLVDFETYLVDNNLARMDRASMAHGLEVRVPMLDQRIIELALSLPAAANPPANGGKLLLRRIAQDRLPEQILRKRKQGFSFPLERFVSTEEMARSVSNGALVGNGILDRAALSAWLHAAQGAHALKLWLLYVLEQWAVRWLFPRQALTA